VVLFDGFTTPQAFAARLTLSHDKKLLIAKVVWWHESLRGFIVEHYQDAGRKSIVSVELPRIYFLIPR